jgi:ATP-binding cassette subfamily B multidrug efflux pump
MEQGRVIEDGTHDSLLAEGGKYAQFWARQSGGFLGQDG